MTFPLCAVQYESNALHFINLSVCAPPHTHPTPLTNVNEEITYMPASQCTLQSQEIGFCKGLAAEVACVWGDEKVTAEYYNVVCFLIFFFFLAD